MSHELYKTWILADTPLTVEQETDLKSHLLTCAECRKVAEGWRGARQQLRGAGYANPAPGFGERWKKTLAERRLAKQKRNTRWLLFGLCIGALLSLGSLVFVLSNTSALLDWLVTMIASVQRTGAWVHQFYLVLSTWLSNLPGFFGPLVILLVASSGFAFLVILWVSIYKKLSTQGVPEL